jgi:hypothetical protein
MRLAYGAVSMALLACSGMAPPTSCKASDRTGTYLTVATERPGGSCGAVPDALGRLTDSLPDPWDPRCTITSERWSEGDCKLERTIECVFEGDGLRTTGVGVTDQVMQDGSHLEGLMTQTAYDLATGATVCVSSYDIAATRQ